MNVCPYMTIPVKPGGRDRTKIDCWGLVVLIYADFLNIALPLHEEINWKDSGEIIVSQAVESDALTHWLEISAQDRREFDVVILRVKGVPWHVGVMTDSDRFIHADPLRGVCVERIEALHWRSRVVGYHRFKNV